MTASTSTAVACAVFDDVSRLRAVVDRNTKVVEDYNSQYEEQYNLVEALGTYKNKPENKSVFIILTLSESRLDRALAREMASIANLTNFRVAEKVVIQAQAAALAATSGFSTTTTTTTTPTVRADKKL